MEKFVDRLCTFVGRTSSDHISPEILAEAGFYLTKEDKIKCFSCFRCETIEYFERLQPPNDARDEHYFHCSFFIENRGKYLEWRESTFDSWPHKEFQTPKDMAEAGFFFLKPFDRVMCFSCFVTVEKWTPQDVPWREHASYSPHCPYLMQNKSEEFIKTFWGDKKPEEELGVLMFGPLGRAALRAGLEEGAVEEALKKKLQDTGAPFTSADELLEAVLKSQNLSTPTIEDKLNYFMKSRTCTDALETGLDRSLVENTVRKQLKETGTSFETADDLIISALASLDELKLSSTSAEDNPPKISVKNKNLEKEIEQLRQEKACKICLEEDIAVLFLPCRHMISCDACSSSLASCPMCRTKIESRHHVYLS